MTQYTYSDDIVSDLHKDARGYRPSQSFWDGWSTLNEDEKQSIWDMLCEEMERSMKEQAAAEKRSLDKFRETVRNTMNYYKVTWDKAVDILCLKAGDDIDCEQSFEYFLWKQGIGYSDRKKIFNLYKETTV